MNKKDEIKELLEMLKQDAIEGFFGSRRKVELILRLEIIIKKL